MSKSMRLLDFQVYASAGGLEGDQQRAVNEALFTTYEPVRLWLQEHTIMAPVRKIVVSLADQATFARWHGQVATALGISEVTEAIDPKLLVENASDHRWVLQLVQHALECITKSMAWKSSELERFIDATSQSALPIVHFFERLARVSSLGVACVPWMSTRPGESHIGVRVGVRDVNVLSRPGPIFLEDNFPLAKSEIRDGAFVLMDSGGRELSRVDVDDVKLH